MQGIKPNQIISAYSLLVTHAWTCYMWRTGKTKMSNSLAPLIVDAYRRAFARITQINQFSVTSSDPWSVSVLTEAWLSLLVLALLGSQGVSYLNGLRPRSGQGYLFMTAMPLFLSKAQADFWILWRIPCWQQHAINGWLVAVSWAYVYSAAWFIKHVFFLTLFINRIDAFVPFSL